MIIHSFFLSCFAQHTFRFLSLFLFVYSPLQTSVPVSCLEALPPVACLSCVGNQFELDGTLERKKKDTNSFCLLFCLLKCMKYFALSFLSSFPPPRLPFRTPQRNVAHVSPSGRAHATLCWLISGGHFALFWSPFPLPPRPFHALSFGLGG